VDIVKQNQQMILCEVLTVIVKTIEYSSGYSHKNEETVLCQVLTDRGKTLGDISGLSGTESTDGSV